MVTRGVCARCGRFGPGKKNQGHDEGQRCKKTHKIEGCPDIEQIVEHAPQERSETEAAKECDIDNPHIGPFFVFRTNLPYIRQHNGKYHCPGNTLREPAKKQSSRGFGLEESERYQTVSGKTDKEHDSPAVPV